MRLTTSLARLPLLVLLSLSGLRAAAAQDPVKQSPDVYKVLLDNDQVRVIEVRLKAGAKSPMHAHPDYVVYALADGKVRFTAPDGKTSEVEIKAGQTAFRPAESHASENIGSGEFHVLNVELKKAAAKDDHHGHKH